MIRHDSLMAACDKIDEAALLGTGWPDALEALATAAGSYGVMIMHNQNRKLVSYVCDRNIAEPVADYLAGRAPPNARQTKVTHDFDPGFRLDYHDFDDATIAHDPYYQDWLRPMGMRWHANARLKMEGGDEIAVSFKREMKHGHYEMADKHLLDSILPRLRAASATTECILDAETRGMVKALHQRGRPVLEFDAWGNVRRQHGPFDPARGPVGVRGNQVRAYDPNEQGDLAKAIDQAVRPPRRQAVVPLTDRAGRRYLLRMMPVVGQARDVFFATSALGILIGRPAPGRSAFDIDLATELFKLTVREAQIVGLLCDGCSTQEIAARLLIVPDTVRYHIKSILEKTGGRRRADVVGIVAQIVC
jgi:DNA-binding CsgD family transcriptional regulator